MGRLFIPPGKETGECNLRFDKLRIGRIANRLVHDCVVADCIQVATKAVTAAVLNGVGDVIAQIFLNENGKFDWKRLGIFSALGLVLIGPALHVWYGTLARVVTASGTMGALGRMAMDQLLFAPIFIGTIVSSIMILEGHGSDVPSKMRSDLFTIVRSNWALWVPFQFLNFRFVPVHLQVLASNIVALAWNTYISWASHTNEKAT